MASTEAARACGRTASTTLPAGTSTTAARAAAHEHDAGAPVPEPRRRPDGYDRAEAVDDQDHVRQWLVRVDRGIDDSHDVGGHGLPVVAVGGRIGQPVTAQVH